MAIEEKNSLELIDSHTVTPGDTQTILSGMDDHTTAYLLIFNNIADSDDGASLYVDVSYNDNIDRGSSMQGAGHQIVNAGVASNKAYAPGDIPRLVDYGTTGSSYETNGHAWIYRQNAISKGQRKPQKMIGKSITYNDTSLVTHDIYVEFPNTGFNMNGIKLFPNSGAWDSGEFKLYKLRRDS